jgi:hypothetical protein
VGDYEEVTQVFTESTVGIPPLQYWISNLASRDPAGGTMSGGEFDWGGRLRKCIGGAQRFFSEWLETIRRVQRHKGGLTATPTGGAGRKLGLSDPVV